MLHPQTQLVWQGAQLLELEQFRHIEDRNRLMAIRQLALKQVKDDTAEATPEFYGRHDAVLPLWDDGGQSLWQRWTPEQQAIELGLRPFRERLTEKQKDTLHLLIDGRLTERQAALVLGISRPSLQERRDGALKTLKKSLSNVFLEVT